MRERRRPDGSSSTWAAPRPGPRSCRASCGRSGSWRPSRGCSCRWSGSSTTTSPRWTSATWPGASSTRSVRWAPGTGSCGRPRRGPGPCWSRTSCSRPRPRSRPRARSRRSARTPRCTSSSPRGTWSARSRPSGRSTSSTGPPRPSRGSWTTCARTPPGASWFWRVQDFADVVGRGGAGSLPPARSTWSPCPPRAPTRAPCGTGSPPCSVSTPAPSTPQASRANTSLGVEQAELLRRVNDELGDRVPLPGPYPSLVKNLLAHQDPGRPSGHAGWPSTSATTEFALQRSREIAERLASHGACDVVGDARRPRARPGGRAGDGHATSFVTPVRRRPAGRERRRDGRAARRDGEPRRAAALRGAGPRPQARARCASP